MADPASRLRTTHSSGRSLSDPENLSICSPIPALEGPGDMRLESMWDRRCAARNQGEARPKISGSAIFSGTAPRIPKMQLTPASSRSMKSWANRSSRGSRPALQVPGRMGAGYAAVERCLPVFGHRWRARKWRKSRRCRNGPGPFQLQIPQRAARLLSFAPVSPGSRPTLTLEGPGVWLSH